MKKKLINSILFWFVILFIGCKNELTPEEFFNKVSKDKAYQQELSVGEFNLSCTYRPSELICLKEISKGGNFVFDQQRYREELKKYENGCYMDLSVALKSGKNVMIEGLSNRSDYAARLGELTYLLANSCFLVSDGKDTVKSLNCLFSNTYGNSPVTRFMVVFPGKQILTAKKSVELVYIDKTFGIGEKAVFVYDAAVFHKTLPLITEQKK